MAPDATVPGSPESGVIHDIGYRHYSGPRLGRRGVWQALFLESARGAYGFGRTARAKVVPLLCLAALSAPAVIMSVVSAVTGADELPLPYTSYALALQPLVALYVAAQAPATVSRDLRFGLVPLHFSRPMRRVDYVSAKYAAFAAAVLVLLATPLTLLFAGALLAQMPLGEQLPDYLRGLVLAVLLAALLAGIGLVLAAVTPRRGLGVAAIITVLLVLAGVQGVVQDVAAQEGEVTLAGWSLLLSPFTLVDGLGAGLLGTDDPLAGGPPGTTGTLVFVLVAVGVVAACWGLLVLRYRRVSAS